ncbi:MAG: S8/S53 family peptidase [Psychroserpens sp.]|uniref:S8/S53 family peptidase n=1 Tax=Psychroserpens sp. TaxID=2020870 RepID=UPI003C71BAB1
MKAKLLLTTILLSSLAHFSQTNEFSNNRIVAALNNTETFVQIDQIRNIDALQFLVSEFQLSSIQTLDGDITKYEQLNNRPLVLNFDNPIPVDEVINQLKATNLFNYVEPDYLGYGAGQMGLPFDTTPTDFYFNRQWGLKNDGSFTLSNSTIDADVDMDQAWDLTTGDSNLIVAILDSGIRMQHPEFAGRLWTNPNEAFDGTDTDNNGLIDDNDGWDFANADNDPTDDHGHGSNVSGITVANGNNSVGYAGVNWQCKLMPIKILDNTNSGFYSWWTAGIYYAVDNGAKIINMSVGGSGFSASMEDAINYAYDNNVSVFVSMMNFNNNSPYYPAAYANTIAVGATDPDDTRTAPFFWSPTSGSNYGNHIDLIAPGNYTYGLSHTSNTNYNSYWGGTSQAAPLVAGIASLMLALNPNLSVDEIRTILRDSADDQVGDSEDTPGWDQFYGAGRANAFSALQQTLSVNDYKLNELKIFPVPVKDELFISTELPIKQYKITNISGQRISFGNVTNNTIDCSQLNQGLYFIELTTTNDVVTVKKIIKQ